MARRSVKPCPVPSCKGHLELGKHPDGAEHEWCVVCERRISQLAALHSRPPAPASGEITDAQLVKLVQSRMWNLTQASKGTKRSDKRVRAAVRSGAIPSARIGRYAIVPREATQAWAENSTSTPGLKASTIAIIAALPRDASKALTMELWSRALKRSRATLYAWAKSHAQDPRLQIGAAVSSQRKPVLTYWWKEDARA